jgi:hypothetical protein
MDPATIISLVSAVLNALIPVASEMLKRAMSGQDMLSVFDHETVEQVLPAQSKLELAMIAERARLSRAAGPA